MKALPVHEKYMQLEDANLTFYSVSNKYMYLTSEGFVSKFCIVHAILVIDMIFLLVKSAPRSAFFVIEIFDNQS